jgi:hypothetical protein
MFLTQARINKMKANETIKKLRDKFQEKEYQGGLVAIDNDEVIELLNDEAVHVQDIKDQETWTLNDGSYITRNDDVYWTGENVLLFEI